MSAQPFDPATYKAEQRQNWSSVAEGWKTWWSTLERGAQPVSERLVHLAGVQPGQKVLDVATGIGEPAVTAAQRVGATGRVVAVDLAPPMLAIAKERATALGLQHIVFREGDAESLDLSEGDFDAILSRWGLMFLPNLPQALGRMKQLLKPGGRLAAAVWGEPSDVPLLSLAMGSMMQVLQLPQPPAEAPGPFSLADAATLQQAFQGAGFQDVHVEQLTIAFEFSSAEEYIRFQQAVAAPVQSVLVEYPADQQEAVWQAMKQAIQSYAAADGSVRLPNSVLCVVGRRE